MADPTETLERDKTAYEQNFEQFRDMNRIMWQVPVLGITITGGFWYAAFAVAEMDGINRALFLMCAALDLALTVVLMRIRFVMKEYLIKLEAFNPTSFVKAEGSTLFTRSYVVVVAFCFALLVAAALSVVMVFAPNALLF
ncbi:hypothetical protein [Mesorhizobium mediterraneum]|uniref:hypothetical protein n=1 Tax=Mesorhizobium mediterraneum TaxID=43617 RepID=UPI00178745D2|nr:hypothetical protein [Mesorhizobium mediterraneum]